MQFNVPTSTFSRRTGGAFLKHLPTGRIVLAHRGIATLGHGRVARKVLFREMSDTLCEATTTDGIRSFFLIDQLESPTLIRGISDFATEFRRAAMKSSRTESSRPFDLPNRSSTEPTGTSKELGEYFDEFSGSYTAKERHATVTDCYHGEVVRAIRDEFDRRVRAPKNLGVEILKNREVDLAIVSDYGSLPL